MKTTLAVVAAIVMPGGLIVLAVSLATFYFARQRGYSSAAKQPELAV
jgi:hypothetical protein